MPPSAVRAALPLLLLCLGQARAQLPNAIRGHLNGSYEGLAQHYLRDSRIGAVVPQDRTATNSFLKLDYTHGGFSGGIQFESYLPPILGFYPVPTRSGSKLVNRYVRYAADRFSITAGDFYEQFGSGLVLRSWENRQIGINNAIEGINITANPAPWLGIKALYGRTRRFFDHSASITRGADAEVDLTRLAGRTDAGTRVTLGGSQVGKYQEYTGPVDGFPATVNATALRFAITGADFSVDGEYVSKGPDPHLLNANSRDRGRAFQLNAAWTGKDQGLTASYRTLYNMDFQNERNEEFVTVAPVNYIPALTKQHDLLTSNIYVYAAQFRGESGFQADWFRNFRPRTRWGGKYGMKVTANISSWRGLDGKRLFTGGGPRYFSDANLEVRKRWSRKFEGIFHLQHLFYNTSVIRSSAGRDMNGFVAAAGGTWKWKALRSVRFMFEHLSTREDDGNWAAGLAEVSIGNPWLVYVSDLYNYGRTDTHYYNLGFAHASRGRRFSLSFGRQRPGLFCVGGVCRFVPAAYGFTAGFTTTFSN